MGDTAKVKLGACNVSFNGTDLGLTKGGVEVEASTTTKKVTVDQFGETEVNEYITGRTIKVTVPLAETDLDTLASVIPGATLVTDGTDTTKKRIDIPTGVGSSLRDAAAVLICHPDANAADDKNEDLTVPLAAPRGDISFAFKYDEERVYAVEFMGYPDNATGLLYQLGDDTATA